MGPPVRTESPTDEADLVWVECDDGSRTLRHLGLNESYHSGCGALSESLCVYLVNSGVASSVSQRRLASEAEHLAECRVLEYGFGTGTSFILTAALADMFGSPLSYLGLENRPLPASLVGSLALADTMDLASTDPGGDLASSLAILADSCGSFELSEFIDRTRFLETRLRQAWEQVHASGQHREQTSSNALANKASAANGYSFHRFNLTPNVELALAIGDATHFDTAAYAECYADERADCDAIYFDAFAPEVAAELWTEAVFGNAFQLLGQSGTLTSYCVKGRIRRSLQAVGFKPRCVPGPPGGKREVLIAEGQ